MNDHHHHRAHSHAHHHGHGVEDLNGVSAQGQNQEFFNKEAASYDSKHEKTLDQIIKEIRARLDFIGVDWVDDDDNEEGNEGDQDKIGERAPKQEVRLLDYACGTGVVSRALAPYTTQSVGIDLSENMVAVYNARVENQGLTHQEMYAYQGNLCSPSDPQPEAFTSQEFHNFDIAAVGLGFHHFDDPALAAKRLAERLKSGGVLLILDFFTHDIPQFGHDASATITHHGFSETEIRRIFEEAGVGKDFALDTVEPIVFNRATESRPEIRRRIFLARGTKE